MIRVNVYATFRTLVGHRSRELELDGCNLREALERLFTDHPALRHEVLDERGELRPHVSLFVAGRDVRREGGLDTPLPAGAVVDLFPPVGGG
jgi:MoaD family protein